MATIKFRRGQESNRSVITPAAGEPLVSLDSKELYIGDGETAGGFPVGTLRPTGSVKAGYVAVFRADNGRELEAIDLNAQLGDYVKETTLDTKVATLQGQITNVEAKADDGVSKAEAAQTAADNAQSTADSANQAVTTLTSTVDTVNQLATDNQTAVQAAQSTASTADSRSSANATAISNLETELNQAKQDFVQQSEFSDLQADVQANTQAIANRPTITAGTTVPDDSVGNNLDLFIETT